MRPNPTLKATGKECAGGLVTAVKVGNGPVKAIASTLTAAEKRVLALVSLAKTNKEIARDLGISPATVKRHLENILRKLALRNRVEAAIYGLTIKGCPVQSGNGCLLKMWRDGRSSESEEWAD
ncbi:MAG: response regulator transcription factor [Candidatus Binatia bacterium]